jgi:hypothetical protein
MGIDTGAHDLGYRDVLPADVAYDIAHHANRCDRLDRTFTLEGS